MKLQKPVLLLMSVITLLACDTKKKDDTSLKETTTEIVKPSKAEIIANETIEAHGGALYDSCYYAFDFRGNTYHFKNEGKNYSYLKTSEKEGVIIKDILENGKFSRIVNDEPVELTKKEIKSATGAINSVIYFATLPHKLNDIAVNKTYEGKTTIEGKSYDVLGVTFNKEGGGEDFDDAFSYWINTKTHKIDYLAYKYKVNNGGVRFRKAYNTRVVDGITFQDYINYKAEPSTLLKDLPNLYEAGKLKELSKIETENIINLNK